jgi:FtsZ-binding cell division protein ZapB
MATANHQLSIQQAETEIAVLKVQVDNIGEKVGEIKQDVKDLRQTIEDHAEENQKMLKEMKDASSTAHKAMSDKISTLEKWRWMMMGAGIVLGTLGYDTVAKLLK